MSKKYDLCIIGAGSGGLSVAAGAAQMGANVVLIERDKMGGDCLNTGCVPSKALLAAAKHAYTPRHTEKFGIANTAPQIDFGAVKDHVHGVIAEIEPHDSQERFEGLGVRVLRGEGKFVDAKTVEINGEKIAARKFVIATGSRAATPPIPGLDQTPYLTNENIFDLREKPEHLIIIGGGPIGVEMAQAHARLGCQVTVIDMGPILPKDDPELVEIVRTQLLAEGISLIENTGIESVAPGVSVALKGGKTVSGSHLLIAAGRKPNTENLNLEAAGIETDRGYIKTGKNLKTSNRKVFAIGDCIIGPQFTHVAGYHAGIVIRQALFHLPAKIDYTALPWVTYTDPELAQAGMTEAQAREEHGARIKVLRFDIGENDRARAEHKSGLIKVITKKNGKILGASIVGPNAGEHIQLWALAISQKMKIGSIASYISPYPTMGEISKRAAGAYYKPALFSDKTKFIVRLMRVFG